MSSNQPIPNGIYTIMGPGGQLTHQGPDAPILLLQRDGNPTQKWEVSSESDAYTLRNVVSGLYLGSDRDPNQADMMIRGSKQPFTWQVSQGPDEEPDTYLLASAASSDSFFLAPSLLRIWPPHVAILPSGGYTPEWLFSRA
ncbi:MULTISPECIES: RICIN domain-containing protein [Nonomuraea]|uniref:RICIN domain-containing protein n=1 Tax=Nonomuraea mangrovi TaxID=2316207 RepID=A0ABW4TBE0_9ACTN